MSTKSKDYWNNKHPKTRLAYRCRAIAGKGLFGGLKSKPYLTDVRSFIRASDTVMENTLMADIFHEMPADILSKPEDERVVTVQKWVIDHIKYVGDQKQWGSRDFWQFPEETIALLQGDCEDGATLIASLLLNAGVPPWRVRVAGGMVAQGPSAPSGGHGYCCLLDEDKGQWVPIDWCYLPEVRDKLAERKTFNELPCYQKVFFSFNHLYVWSHDNFTSLEGRAKDLWNHPKIARGF